MSNYPEDKILPRSCRIVQKTKFCIALTSSVIFTRQSSAMPIITWRVPYSMLLAFPFRLSQNPMLPIMMWIIQF